MSESEQVILVNNQDEPLGLMDKLEAHKKGLLHRAFSVFIFNDQGQMMLQKRAGHKYHSPGLWSNTCCSHPRQGETNIKAGTRRLIEEMGFETPLTCFGNFIYHVKFTNGLTEHEFDHLLAGYCNLPPKINKNEVDDWKWADMEQIKTELKQHPELYTAWFKIIIEKYHDTLAEASKKVKFVR